MCGRCLDDGVSISRRREQQAHCRLPIPRIAERLVACDDGDPTPWTAPLGVSIMTFLRRMHAQRGPVAE